MMALSLYVLQNNWNVSLVRVRSSEDQILASALKFIHAGISEQIKDKPVGVEILGEKLVLVRDSNGVVQCLQDVCPHRGAPLHMG